MSCEWLNKDPQDWSKETWQELYSKYCQNNQFGPKSKREYYDMVMENFRKLATQSKPLSDELREQWLKGWRNAVVWAKKRGCDLNGRLLRDTQRDAAEASVMEIADRAESIAIDTAQRLDHIIDMAKRRRMAQ